MTSDEARRFAEEWVAAWNARDLPRVLSHYADDVVFLSPVAKRLTGEGRVVGKGDLQSYWAPALAAFTDLHFEIVEVLVGFEAVTILYDSRGRGRVAETFEFGSDGRVVRAAACYA